ncbi:hypothetical protein ACFE04_004899 [Oxalis oulophora]
MNPKRLLHEYTINSPPPMTVPSSGNDTSSSSSQPPPPTTNPNKVPLHPLDSSMGITFLVLLAALFFMGFFSIYIRRSSNPSNYGGSRYRRHWGPHVPSLSLPLSREQTVANSTSTTRYSHQSRGTDTSIVRSLPVYSYSTGGAKYYQSECLICLGEFEEREAIKTIPYCSHAFHLQCIDRWLAWHVTCPVCRGRQFFKTEKCRGGDDTSATTAYVAVDVERLGGGMRKSSSCSNLGARVSSSLHRTLSF